MQCPKCGYRRQKKDDAFVLPTECPACGIVYAKYESGRLAGRMPMILRRSSPLDESTLKKARERVELRLRKKMMLKAQAEEKARTMELARRIFSEQLRRRLEQGEKEALSPAGKTGGQIPHPNTDANNRPEQKNIAAGPEAMALFVETTPVELKRQDNSSLQSEIRIESDNQQPADIDKPYAQLEPEPFPEPQPAATSGRHPGHAPADPPRWLPLAGIFTLTAGIVGALVSWATLQSAQAKTIVNGISIAQGFPLELVIGFCYLAVGLLGGALFWTIFVMSRRQNKMRQILSSAGIKSPENKNKRLDT